MKQITRADVAAQMAALVQGEISLDQLRSWFTPIMVAESADLWDPDSALVSRLIFLAEDDSIPDRDRPDVFRRLVCCLGSSLDNDTILELIPAISDQNRLCSIIHKYRAGIISRTGFVSFVSKTRYSERVKRWLQATRREGLSYLCRALESEDYEEVAELVSR